MADIGTIKIKKATPGFYVIHPRTHVNAVEGLSSIISSIEADIEALQDMAPAEHRHDFTDIDGTATLAQLPTISVAKGGTGRTSLTSGSVLVGNGTSAVSLVSRSGIDTRNTFPPSGHGHAISEITNLQTTLNLKLNTADISAWAKKSSLAFADIPTGTGASQVAVGNHNHDSFYQPLDGDLTSIAGLTGTTGLLRKTAANTWTLDNASYLTSLPAIMTTTEGNTGTATTQRTINAANLKAIVLNHSPAGSRPASDVSAWAKKSALAHTDIPYATQTTRGAVKVYESGGTLYIETS